MSKRAKPYNHEPTYTNFHLAYARHQAHPAGDLCPLCEKRGLGGPLVPNPALFDLFSSASRRSEK